MSRKRASSDTKVAWLIPSMERGFFWLKLLEKFSNLIPATKVFTGVAPMNHSPDQVLFDFNIIGKTRYLRFRKNTSHYDSVFIIPPLSIILHIIKFVPDVVFTYGFSLWTLITLLLKPIMRWRVIVIYEGSSPTVDDKQSRIRLSFRRLMSKLSDAFLTNTESGQSYLVDKLNIRNELVFARPYIVPDVGVLRSKKANVDRLVRDSNRPIFLYVGLLIHRKGIKFLLNALSVLKGRGYENYTVIIAGDGQDREELQDLAEDLDLENNVVWLGWFDYKSLGYLYEAADVFILPTYEDTWGMVVIEAMVFATPVLCSRLAGTYELIQENDNGYTFDPVIDKPAILAGLMERFIKNPTLISIMGDRAKATGSSLTPYSVASYLKSLVEFVLAENHKHSKKLAEYLRNQY